MDESRPLLTDKTWARIEKALTKLKSRRGAPADTSDRDFVEAILYLARTGAPWRDLPGRFGNWDAAYKRFRRWADRGIWAGLLVALPARVLKKVRVLLG